MLYVPGDKPRALEKARALPVDGVIIDLEDAVAPDAKNEARKIVAAAVTGGDWGWRELILRVSDAGCAADFALAESLPIDGVLLPKVERPETVANAAAATRHALWCMIETPLGVLRAAEIAGCHPRLAGLVAGTNDLAKDLHARHVPDRTPLLTALSLILLAARGYGIAALDGVHLELDDLEALEKACRQGVELGFDGKTLVHPNSVDIANRVFGPDAEAVGAARATVAAWAQARAAGKGVARIDGRMVEQLHVDQAQRLIDLADAIEARG